MASKTDKFIGGQFPDPMKSKEKFAIADCEDIWAKRILEFLILILYPKKPTGVIIRAENTIFGAQLGDRSVD